MPIRFAALAVALALCLAACGDSGSSARPTPIPSATPPAATATAAATNTVAPTHTAVPSHTPPATATAAPSATSTAPPTATATPDAARCGDAAASALRACVAQLNTAEHACYLDGGAACPADTAAVTAALAAVSDAVAAGCADATAVRAAGFGPAFTVESLVGRLQAACRAETASLATRAFGGPLGAGLAGADASQRSCLASAHDGGAALLDEQLDLYHDCIAGQRDGTPCDAAATEASADATRADLALAVGTACAALPALVSVDPPTFASRAAAQARCLTAIAHPDAAPLSLDCGPRAELPETPRGQYVQVVLDPETSGARCGDGSPYAFWIRLAPAGAPLDHVVVGLQGGGVCIFGADCATRPADLFEALSDQPETGGPLSDDPQVSPFADWTKVFLPYCTQDVFIGGGTTSNFPEITVERYGAVDTRAALRTVRDILWRELDRNTVEGYRPDRVRALFGGFSAGGFGTIYNYHWVLDDLQWAHTAAYPDAGLALDNGETIGVATLGALVINGAPPLGWAATNYLPSYCTSTDCGVGPVLLAATSPRLLAVPEQQLMILSNQVDLTQVETTYFSSTADWINALRTSYCATRQLPGVNYFLPAIPENVHVISPRPELYTSYPIGGVLMRDWLASAFTTPDQVGDHVEEGTLVTAYPGVMPFACPVTP